MTITTHLRPIAIWAAVIAPVWLLLALCTYWEPVVRDSWGHVWWHHSTDVSLFEFAKDTYIHNNPRIGQVITWLLLTPGPWHVIVTPLVELSMFYLLAALVLGRWPSPRRTDDALVVATVIAMVFATCPLIGPMLVYRPFTGNYLYGVVLNLALLVPYRIGLEHREHSGAPLGAWWLVPVMVLAGLASGLANEHTGPTVAALCLGACALAWRRGQLRAWMIAGLAGMIAGSAMLYYAPGQDVRYEGLATQQSLLDRIAARGTDNLDILTLLFRYLRPLVFWLGLVVACYVLGRALARRRIPVITWVLCGAALAITLTLLASPKQGPRLYLASVAFACAAAASLVHAQLHGRWSRAVAWVLAVVFTVRAGTKLLTVYASVGPEAHDRLTRILEAAPGTRLTVAPYSQPRSRWFMGDDLVYAKWRDYVAVSFGLAAIEMTGQGVQRPATMPEPEDDP